MELLNNILPNDIINKIRMYHSHPISDMMKTWIITYEFQARVCKTTKTFSADYFEWFKETNKPMDWNSDIDDDDSYDYHGANVEW